MKLTVLGSGSTGNAVLLVTNGTRVLVDAGLSTREIARRMALMGEDPNALDGILITHEHGDHAGGLRGRRHRIESQPRHAQDGRCLSVGIETADSLAAGPSLERRRGRVVARWLRWTGPS